MPFPLRPYQRALIERFNQREFPVLANPQAFRPTPQFLGRGIRGVHLFPSALKSHSMCVMHDGVGYEVVLDDPQWQAAKHFAQSDTTI